MTPVIVYVSIGNSDDKLSQARWADFCTDLHGALESLGQVHGDWYSLPDSPYQNACLCIEFPGETAASAARRKAAEIGRSYGQDAVAWARAAGTEFV